jgi:signal transduction histidine kinase
MGLCFLCTVPWRRLWRPEDIYFKMRIRLISDDQFLYNLCREVLLKFRGRDWDFAMVASEGQMPPADLLIWDLSATRQPPQRLNSDPQRKNIFLIDRKEIGALQGRLPLGWGFVLKPVNPVLLHALIEEAVTQHETADNKEKGETAEQLRRERDEMLQYLLQANLKLQEYDQDRTNFLAHSVHDIRAPLVAIQGYCSLLLDSQLGDLNPEQTKVLERMQRSIKRLSRLASGMFYLSVDPQSPRRLSRKQGDIEACINQAVHELAPVLESKQIEMRLSVQPPAQILLFDEMQIEQVLVNLLDNATRFTPRKGRIEIMSQSVFWERRRSNLTGDASRPERRESATRECNAYRVEVRDSGCGVPAGDVEWIFEEYATGAKSYESSRAGLGLTICRQIINAHRGSIFAEAGGSGGCFVFVLPFGEVASRPPPLNLPIDKIADCAVE